MNNTQTRRSTGGAAALALIALAGCGGGNDPIADNACTVLASDGSSVVVGGGKPGDPTLPEPTSGYRTSLKAVFARSYMVTSSNGYASLAGCKILQQGGSAADAAVAVQSVLGLTVPEATGYGGGGFVMHYNATMKAVQAYDGRESAPATATENYLRYIDDVNDKTTPRPSARASGRSIGTLGIPRLMEKVQKDHGRLAFKDLFVDSIALATNGFPIGGRLAASIASNEASLKRDAEAAAYFYNADGSPKALGTILKNPAYANVLTKMAAQGADAIMTGPIAQDIVNKIQITRAANDNSVITPGKTTLADMAAYQVKVRTPVCTTYRVYTICGMPPPTSGGITVASAMGILENFDMAQYKPTAIDGEGGKPTVLGVHLVSEAERLAYSDRDKYIADTDFVPLPRNTWDTLLNKPYLKSRAALIKLTASMGTATAGVFSTPGDRQGIDTTPDNGTSHFTIVDGSGNVVSATTTVESGMGSFHMSNGMILNNQLTDFSATPTDAAGAPIANSVAANKRPRSSMSPTLVFRTNAAGQPGDFVMATGSPGGSTIPQYVVKTLVGVLDWGLDAQQSSNLVDFGASNSVTTTLGGEHPNIDTTNNGANDPLLVGLRGLGHTVSTGAQSSGVNSILRAVFQGTPIWAGGTDPRREGIVLGDLFKP